MLKKNKKKTGRPTKLTPETVERIIQSLEWGNYLETAAAYAGISKETLFDWLKKGANSDSGPHKEFSDSVKKVMAVSEMRDVKNIAAAAASGQWQASAWRLERKYPDRWGKRDHVEVTGQDGGPIEITAARKILVDRITAIRERIGDQRGDREPE